jgi:hypothetical protein
LIKRLNFNLKEYKWNIFIQQVDYLNYKYKNILMNLRKFTKAELISKLNKIQINNNQKSNSILSKILDYINIFK